MASLRIERYTVGPFATNCYLVWTEPVREAVIIDPGGDAGSIFQALNAGGLRPAAVLLTHGHVDHVMALPAILARYDVPVFAHEAEREIIGSVPMQAQLFGLPPVPQITVTDWIAEGDLIVGEEMHFRVLHTPGHSPGSCCYLLKEEIFVGDTLFESSVGRTDLPGGDYSLLIRSIREKLFVLPDEAVVYPGHGGETTVGREKKFNPFLRGAP